MYLIEDHHKVIYAFTEMYFILCCSKYFVLGGVFQPIIYNSSFIFFQHLLSDCHQALSKGDQYSVLDKVISTMHFNFSTISNQDKR